MNTREFLDAVGPSLGHRDYGVQMSKAGGPWQWFAWSDDRQNFTPIERGEVRRWFDLEDAQEACGKCRLFADLTHQPTLFRVAPREEHDA